MTKIAVMSDNHGNGKHIEQVLERESDAKYFFHCGDYEVEDERVERFKAVVGNNDYWSELPVFIRVKVEDLWFGIIHGNQFGYFNREEAMLSFMEAKELDVLCSGHTHTPMFLEYEGKYLINPGSTLLPRGGSKNSYCVLEVNGKEVRCEFKEIIKEDK